MFEIRKSFMGIALVLSLLAIVFHASSVSAKVYEVIQTPPAFPAEMQRGGSVGSTTPVPLANTHIATMDGKKIIIHESGLNDAGFALPATSGETIWFPAGMGQSDAVAADARELKLKIRELASQLIANMDPSLKGHVAVPTSFVNQEDFSQSSPLGRFIGEQLIYEFNQRCFPIKEYRLGSAVRFREEGDLLLSRKASSVSTKTKGALFVVGTYFVDRQAVFVNARLVRGNGSVLRTAQIILPNTAITKRMAAGGGKILKKGTLPIRDFKTETQPTNLTPFDLGQDVH